MCENAYLKSEADLREQELCDRREDKSGLKPDVPVAGYGAVAGAGAV